MRTLHARVFLCALTLLGCDSWSSIAGDVFDGYRVTTINEHRYARRLFYRLQVNFQVRFLAPQITVGDAYFRRALMSDSLAWVAGAPRTVVALPYINERTRAEYTWYMSQGWEVIDTGAYPDHETIRHAAFIAAVTGQSVAPATPVIAWREQAGIAQVSKNFSQADSTLDRAFTQVHQLCQRSDHQRSVCGLCGIVVDQCTSKLRYRLQPVEWTQLE